MQTRHEDLPTGASSPQARPYAQVSMIIRRQQFGRRDHANHSIYLGGGLGSADDPDAWYTNRPSLLRSQRPIHHDGPWRGSAM